MASRNNRMSGGVFVPSPKAYTMNIAGASMVEMPGYQSLYGANRSDFDMLSAREETYLFYPQSEVPKASLAAAGFYFTGENDISRCYCCKLEIGRLKRGEDPIDIHRRRSRNCPFVTKQDQSQAATLSQQWRDSDCSDCIDGPIHSNSNSLSSLELDSAANNELEVMNLKFEMQEKLKLTSSTTAQHKDGKHVAKSIDKQALRQENERLRSTITCRKCCKTKVQTLFLPCRHLVACEECAEKMDDCINCGQKILGTVRTFLI